MFKSILYYILMIAEFCSTMFVGGIVIGIYLQSQENWKR